MGWTGLRTALLAVLLACTAAFMLSCDGASDGAREDAAASDSPGLDAGEFNADTLFLDVAQFVGILDGAPEYLFGSISSVATDAERRTYVGDRTGASVRAFAEDGGFLGWIAREGGGPGEINSWPANLLVGADGRLYVRDGARVTVFGTRTEGSMPDSVVELWNTGPGNLTSSRSGLARDGQYFYPGGRFRPNEPPRYFYTSFRDGEADGDTLPVPDYPGLTGLQPALLRLGVDALMLRGLSHVPFSAVPVWDVTPTGTLLSSDGASSILLETDERGDTVRGITLPQTSLRSVPARERADSLAALDERITGAPGPLNQATGIGDGVEDRRLPEFLPPVIGLSVSQDGSIWVERWPPEEDANSRYYDVLNGNGRLQRVVVLRAPLLRDPPPWFGSRSVVGVVRDAETGVERVARFDLPDLESTTR